MNMKTLLSLTSLLKSPSAFFIFRSILKIDNMKFDIRRSFFVSIFALFFAFILDQQTLAQCTESNLQNSGNNVSGHNNAGQTFTASCAGVIESVTVYYNSIPASTQDRILNIRDGALPTSTIIHTQVIPYNSLVTGANVFTISSSVPINASEINAWEITDASVSNGAAIGISWNNPGTYPLGDAWFTSSFNPGHDLTFSVQIGTVCTPALGTDVQTVCNSYTWIDGNNYTSSNNTATYNIVGGAANGCDSLVALDLTIINSATGTDTRTECNTYTWIDGNTYTASNNSATFNIVGGAANGCDSLVTLNLTILNSATGTDTRTECNTYTWIDGNTYTTSNNSATFNIVGGAANGCDSLVTLNLTINSVSDLSTSISGVTISANNSNATYQWLDCDNGNAIITGENNQIFTATSNGNYAVALTENGCVDTSACVAITTVGILENNFGTEFNIYPNPTDGKFSIDLGSIYENIQISITDLSGKLIESKIKSQSQILNLSIEEPAGIYIIAVQANDNKAVIRLIKK